MSSFDSIRRSVSQAASETVTTSDFMVVLRTMGVMTFVMGCLGAYMWSQMQVTRISVALDESRSELARAETVYERLLLEKSAFVQPGRLQDEANIRGMVAPVHVKKIKGLPTSAENTVSSPAATDQQEVSRLGVQVH